MEKQMEKRMRLRWGVMLVILVALAAVFLFQRLGQNSVSGAKQVYREGAVQRYAGL